MDVMKKLYHNWELKRNGAKNTTARNNPFSAYFPNAVHAFYSSKGATTVCANTGRPTYYQIMETVDVVVNHGSTEFRECGDLKNEM